MGDDAALFIRAWRAVDATIATGADHYDRDRMLPRLLPVLPGELGDDRATTRRIVKRLARAIRIERANGRAGHWTYDLNRHIGLLQAYRHELNRLYGRTASQATHR